MESEVLQWKHSRMLLFERTFYSPLAMLPKKFMSDGCAMSCGVLPFLFLKLASAPLSMSNLTSFWLPKLAAS